MKNPRNKQSKKKEHLPENERWALLSPILRETNDITPKTKDVLNTLVYMRNSEFNKDNGWFYSTDERLAEFVTRLTGNSISVKTVSRSISSLSEYGLITILDRPCRRGSATKYQVNIKPPRLEGVELIENPYQEKVDKMEETLPKLGRQIGGHLGGQNGVSQSTKNQNVQQDIDIYLDTVSRDNVQIDNVNKKKKYNSNSNCNTVPVDNTVNDDIFFKKKKLNKKEKGNTDSDGTVDGENNFLIDLDMEHGQGEQGSNSIKSYDDVINAVMNRIRKKQSFSEKGLRDYIFEQFISKGTVTQQQWDSDLFLLQKMKELVDVQCDVTEHTDTPTEKNDNATEYTVTPSEEIDKPYTKHTSKVNTSKEIKDSQSMGDDSHPSSYGKAKQETREFRRRCLTDTPKRSYGDVYWQVRKMIEKGKGFSEEKVRDYVHEHFIITGEVPQHEFEADLSELQRLKESLEEKKGYATEDVLVSALTSEPFVPYGLTAEA